jgi:hypothetical protein
LVHERPGESSRGILTRNYGWGEEAVPIDIVGINEMAVARPKMINSEAGIQIE